MPSVAIIDDTEDHRDILFYLLRDRYDVVGYETGGDALAAFRLKKPDLIILDMGLPDMDGIDVLLRLRADAALKDTPVIALTAQAMEGDRERCLTAGCNDYVSKPILHPDKLVTSIERLIAA